MRRPTAFLAFALASASGTVLAERFLPLAHTVRQVGDTVDFQVEFNQVPDFATVDEYARSKHDFQFYIIGAPTIPSPVAWDSIIRTESAYFSAGLLTIQDGQGGGGPGGWGPLRGTIPYSLSGTILTFSAPISMLTDRPVSLISYNFEMYEYGAMTYSAVAAVPEAPTIMLFAIGLAALHRRLRPACRQSGAVT